MSATARTHLLVLSILAFIALVVLVWLASPWGIVLWWGIWGAVTFAYYGYDKRQAGYRGWRVPESILHLLALSGGFVGGWSGMTYFQHKTRHTAFKVILAVATLAWVSLFLWLQRGLTHP